MPTQKVTRPAFPCLACIREQSRPDNDWYTGVAEIVVWGNVTSVEIWSLLRRRDGQNSHHLINGIINVIDEDVGLNEKARKVAEILREYGVPLAEEEHTCGV